MDSDGFDRLTARGIAHEGFEDYLLRGSPFTSDSLLVDVHGDPGICVSKHLLSDLDVGTSLAKQVCHAVAERVPSDVLFDAQPFECPANVATGRGFFEPAVFRSPQRCGRSIVSSNCSLDMADSARGSG